MSPASAGPERRKPYHHGALNAALVEASIALAREGGPDRVVLREAARAAGVSHSAAYRHFADREALLAAVAAEAFRQFNAELREAVEKPSKRSRLSRFARAVLGFGLRRNGIFRLMFASRVIACAAADSELHTAASQTFALLVDALEAPAIGLLRERQALKIWASLHGVVMLAEQGLLTGQVAGTTREELVEDIVSEAKLALAIAIEGAMRDGRASSQP